MSVEVVICPLCRAEIHRHVRGDVETRLRVPSGTPRFDLTNAMAMLAEMAAEETRAEMAAAEQACVDHYQRRHPLRLRLWRRLGWTWLMRWPTRKPARVRLDTAVFDPVRFIR